MSGALPPSFEKITNHFFYKVYNEKIRAFYLEAVIFILIIIDVIVVAKLRFFVACLLGLVLEYPTGHVDN